MLNPVPSGSLDNTALSHTFFKYTGLIMVVCEKRYKTLYSCKSNVFQNRSAGIPGNSS